MPEHYSPGSIWLKEWEKTPNDQLMYNLIDKYAKEGKGENGKPNGRFYVDKNAVKKVSEPIVAKYLPKLDKDQQKNLWTVEFEELFGRFDVLDSGFIEVEQMGRFLKSLVHDQTIDIQ